MSYAGIPSRRVSIALFIAAMCGAGIAGAGMAAFGPIEPPPAWSTVQAYSDADYARELLNASRDVPPVLCALAARAAEVRHGDDGRRAPIASWFGEEVGSVVEWVSEAEPHGETVELLLSALAEPNPCVRRMAATLLGRAENQGAIRALERALHADAAGTRAAAALALGLAESRSALEPLARAVLDAGEAVEVRATAAWALGRIEDRAAIPALKDALRDRDPQVRQAARQALDWMRL